MKDGGPEASMIEGLATLMQNLRPVVEACAGYKQIMLSNGFTETTSEQGAQILHAQMLQMIFAHLANATQSK